MVGENKIDETPDACRRSIANVVIGTLFADRSSDIFLLDSQVLDAVNNFTIAILFDNAMGLLWGGEVIVSNRRSAVHGKSGKQSKENGALAWLTVCKELPRR